MPKRRSKRKYSRKIEYPDIYDSHWWEDSNSGKMLFYKTFGYDGHYKLKMRISTKGEGPACSDRDGEYYRTTMHELWEVVCNSDIDHLSRKFEPEESFDANKLHKPGISLNWPYSISPSHLGIKITGSLGEMMRMNMVSIRNLLLLIKYIECGTIQEVIEEVLTADGVQEHEMYVFKWTLRELRNGKPINGKPIALGKFFHKNDVIMKKILSRIIGMEGRYSTVVEKHNNGGNSSCYMGIPKSGYIPGGDWQLNVAKFLLNYHSQFLDAAIGELGVKRDVMAEMKLVWNNVYDGALSSIAVMLGFSGASDIFKIDGLDYDRLGHKDYDVLEAMRSYNRNPPNLENGRMGYKEFGGHIREMIEDLQETRLNPPRIPSHLIDVGWEGKEPLIGDEALGHAATIGMSIISVITTILLLGICFIGGRKTSKRRNEQERERC